MIRIRFGALFSLLSFFVFSCTPSFANGVRADLGASGKGVVNPTGGCVATIETNPACVDFSTSGTLPTWTAFQLISTDPDVVDITGPYNLFVVSGISSITFQLTGNAAYGSFLCGTDPSMITALSGNCTDIALDPPTNPLDPPLDLTGFLAEDDSNLAALNQVTFNFLNGSIGTPNGIWVFYATAGDASILSTTGGTTPTPEPGTLFLLAAGAGLLAVAKLRRT